VCEPSPIQVNSEYKSRGEAKADELCGKNKYKQKEKITFECMHLIEKG
jgi:hypothetical protein